MPAKSEKQRRAMHAAAKGKSTLGIPKSVGREYVNGPKGYAVERSNDSHRWGKDGIGRGTA